LVVAQNTTDGETGGEPGSSLDAQRLIAALSAIIGLGFLGFLLFDRLRIADTLILIGFGVLLGPVTQALDPGLFRTIMPLVGTFALLIIMFDGGLDLDFRDLAAALAWSLLFSGTGFVLAVAAVAAVAHYVLGVGWLVALMLGAALGGTSGMVVLPIVNQLKVPPKVRTGLYVETFVPDLLSITTVVILMDIALAEGVDVREVSRNIVVSLTIAILVGVGAGLLWIKALEWLGRRRYAYMMTLAIVLFLAVAVEFLQGNGPLAVLGFGLVLGNRHMLGAWGKVERPTVFRDMQGFNNELAFLVRSFFFVALGIVLDLNVFTAEFLLFSLLVLGAIVASRVITVMLTASGSPTLRANRGLMIAMLPRGLTAAVLVSLPAAQGIPGTERFPAYALVIVVLTNAVLTLGVYLFFRAAARGEDDASASG
jgi:cell volume regulation protein A